MPVRMREKRRSKSKAVAAEEKNSDSLLKMTHGSALLESLLGNDSSSINLSRRSEGNRKSLPYMSDSQETNLENDTDSEIAKEEEKEELCNAIVNESKSADRVARSKQPVNLPISIEKNLSPEELESHYSQCIDLFSKNKVNAKNAFKLQLIDCMKLIMDRKSEKSENLTLMSCTLDASAKIYSCRVDNVYTNILKFVKSYQSGGKPKKEDEDGSEAPAKESGNESSDEENDQGKKKKKKKKAVLKSFIKPPESSHRDEIEMVYYRQNLPRSQNYFLESSILDDGYELAPNRPLFAPYTPQENTSNYLIESVWRGETDRDNFEEKIPGYKDLRSKLFIADDGPQEETHLELDNSYTFDPSVEDISKMRPFSDICDGQSSVDGGDLGDPAEIEVDYDDCDPNPIDEVDLPLMNGHNSTDRLSSVPDDKTPTNTANNSVSLPLANGTGPRVSFTPIAMSKMLRSASSKHSDYSYFDDSKLAFMPSASHWKIKPSKRSIDMVGKTVKPTRKGKTMYLDFESEDQMKIDINSIQEHTKMTNKLCIKTTKDWFHSKINLIFMPVIPYARKNLLSLCKDVTTCILSTVSTFDAIPNGCDMDESAVLNPQDFGTQDDSFDDDGGDDHGGGYHPLEDWSEKADDLKSENEIKNNMEEDVPLKENTTSSEEQIDDLDLLVPAPVRVEKVSVKFAKAQKRIDIKKLKSAIWNLLDFEDKENVNDKIDEEIKYSDIFSQIPSKISKEAAAELSYPIAFMAILHMANEKNLRLTGNEKHSDLTVKLDTPP